MGAGINSTSSIAIVATHFKDEREKAIGFIEASSGIGLLLGPFFGALLYEIGGYVLPFVATGKKFSLITNLLNFSLTILYIVPLDSSITDCNSRSRENFSTLGRQKE